MGWRSKVANQTWVNRSPFKNTMQKVMKIGIAMGPKLFGIPTNSHNWKTSRHPILVIASEAVHIDRRSPETTWFCLELWLEYVEASAMQNSLIPSGLRWVPATSSGDLNFATVPSVAFFHKKRYRRISFSSGNLHVTKFFNAKSAGKSMLSPTMNVVDKMTEKLVFGAQSTVPDFSTHLLLN